MSPHIILLLSAVGILKIPFNEAVLFVAVFMAIRIIFLVYLSLIISNIRMDFHLV